MIDNHITNGRTNMVNIVTSLFDKQTYDTCNIQLFTNPLTEHAVLDLQAIFTTPGVHVVKMKNIQESREIIQTILQSLNYYKTIGCVTNQYNIPNNVYDIVGHITLQKQEASGLLFNLEDFFAQYPCFDFIWVESTQQFQQKCSLDDMKKIFYMYHAEERMPVIFIIYEEEK